jgi:hypothetical protein
MRRRDYGIDKILRRALSGAGIVEHYELRCRRAPAVPRPSAHEGDGASQGRCGRLATCTRSRGRGRLLRRCCALGEARKTKALIHPKTGAGQGLQMVGATGFEPATTCTPTMTPSDAPVSTGRTESQRLGITGAQDPPPAAQGAQSAPPGTGNGAHMGRGRLPESEGEAAALDELGRQVAEAVARGEFQRARELTEDAIRRRAATAASRDPAGGAGE